MHLMKRFNWFSASLFLVAAFSTGAQEVGVLHLRPLHLEIPATWSFDGSKNPIEGLGPNGEKALVSIMRRKPSAASEPTPSAREITLGFSSGPMHQLAKNAGQVIRPVSELAAPEGKIIYSSGSEKSAVFSGKSYFVQYAIASPGVLIYITFEGKGELGPAMQQFDGFIATQRWDE